MATYPQYDSWEVPVPSTAEFGKHLRVRMDSNGELVLAGASESGIGNLTERGASAGIAAAVRVATAPSNIGVSSAAIAVGGDVFAAANGQVAPTGTVQIGQARTATSGAGELVLYHPIDAS